jgi:hypothetical protein
MSAIPTTQRKLRHARETFQLLQASARAIPLEREEVERRSSDFLSAAYSVEDVLKDEIGKPRVDRWWSKRDADEQALHRFMRGQRKAELHHRGAAVNTKQQEISYTDYLRHNKWMQSGRSGGYVYGPQWFGPYVMEIPRIPVEIDILMLGGEEVAEKCGQCLKLLEQTVNAFREATAGATEHQQKQAKMRPYKIRLDPESQALMEQLHQPGESVDALVVRALRAIHEGGRS